MTDFELVPYGTSISHLDTTNPNLKTARKLRPQQYGAYGVTDQIKPRIVNGGRKYQ